MSDVSDIFPVQRYGPQKPPSALKFLPWHKPRKQYVRAEQWLGEYQWLGDQRPEGSTIRYLGLPGADLLDLRFLTGHPDAQRRNQGIRFLGFDRSAKPGMPGHERLNISERELRDLPMVDSRSKVLQDDFMFLADKDSLAWEAANDFDCFDLINLDLCGSLTLEKPDLTLSNYDAILALMRIQNYQRRPWSLLLTTRVGHDKVDRDVRKKLWKLFEDNMDGCLPFAEEVESWFGFKPAAESELDAIGQQDFFNVMVVAISKWMLQYGLGMKARMELGSVAAYQVYGGSGAVDMVSLVFRFTPEADLLAGDPASLAAEVPSSLSECDLAAPLPQQVAEAIDIDELLNADPAALANYTSESADLLEAAHYDRAAYLAWLAADRISSSGAEVGRD